MRKTWFKCRALATTRRTARDGLCLKINIQAYMSIALCIDLWGSDSDRLKILLFLLLWKKKCWSKTGTWNYLDFYHLFIFNLKCLMWFRLIHSGKLISLFAATTSQNVTHLTLDVVAIPFVQAHPFAPLCQCPRQPLDGISQVLLMCSGKQKDHVPLPQGFRWLSGIASPSAWTSFWLFKKSLGFTFTSPTSYFTGQNSPALTPV